MVKLAWLLIAGLSGGLAVVPEPHTDWSPPVLLRVCASDYCPPEIPGPVTRWPWSSRAQYLSLDAKRVQLTNLDHSVVWTAAVSSRLEPDLVAEGDFTGDGVPDFIFEEVRPVSPVQYCAGKPMDETQLLFVDGASGRSWRPVPPLLDICWEAYGYRTHQWGVGSGYIGGLAQGYTTNQVVLFPYYATSGTVLVFDRTAGWKQIATLPYPSTPAFDSAYNAANHSPCLPIPGADHCFAKYSHVANAIFVGKGGPGAGLMVLTTNRAVIYRPDFTPTSDYVWGYPEGGGRDYGLVESHDVGGDKVVTLVGGCSVAKTHDTMRTGELSDDPCGLFHHYEYFLVHGQSIVQHSGRFFGWYGSVGLWQDRLEFPFPSQIPLTGGSNWSVFNLYRDGQWRAQLLPDPANPDSTIEVPGWYVWGSVTDGFGRVMLAATRTRATDSTAVESYVPPWEFDLLQWRDGQLVPLLHRDGVVPSLVLYPPGPDYHVSDGDTFGLVETRPFFNPFGLLMVESRDGVQSYVTVP